MTLAVVVLLAGCAGKESEVPAAAAAQPVGGLAAVKDDRSEKDVVKVAAGSPDHSTLVTAVTKAGLVDVLASSGPYTVFAPTNAAFAKLPPGTVDDLLKPANLDKLQAVLRHHVTTSAYQLAELKDGMVLSMADGTNATISVKGADVFIGGAKIVGSVRASNGMVHVIDAVVVPK